MVQCGTVVLWKDEEVGDVYLWSGHSHEWRTMVLEHRVPLGEPHSSETVQIEGRGCCLLRPWLSPLGQEWRGDCLDCLELQWLLSNAGGTDSGQVHSQPPVFLQPARQHPHLVPRYSQQRRETPSQSRGQHSTGPGHARLGQDRVLSLTLPRPTVGERLILQPPLQPHPQMW